MIEIPSDLNLEASDAVAAILRARTADELNEILVGLVRSGGGFLSPDVRGRKLYAREFDQAVAQLPRRLGLEDRPATETGDDNVVLIATEFYEVGGHTRVAADIARLVGRENLTVVLTDIYQRNRLQRHGVRGFVNGVDIPSRAFLALRSPTMVDRIHELYNILSAIRPSRIFLLNHHVDVCAVAGSYPFRDVVDFVHHADYQPCLGATLPYARHADLTFWAHLCCKANVAHPVYAAMTQSPETGPPEAGAALTPGRGVLLATCGHFTKYLQPGTYAWTDWVLGALADPRARFVHIGPAKAEMVASMQAALAEAGVSADRYEFIGATPNLRAELIARGVDVYVSSAPESGERANIEALSAGIPVVLPRDPSCPPLIHFMSPLPGWFDAARPADLPAVIAQSLAFKPELATAAFRARFEREAVRFERYVAGEPSPEISLADVSG